MLNTTPLTVEDANKLDQVSAKDREYYFQRISSLGDFFMLNHSFGSQAFEHEISSPDLQWVPYNKSKKWSNRYGLSLTSLDGGITGEIDLNSVMEWNKKNGTHYNEMSFRTKTPYWRHFHSVTSQLGPLEPSLGRSHLIRLAEGGIFPPHRDNYGESDRTFRLISFFQCTPDSLHMTLDDRKVAFNPNCLYFMNTRKVHSVVSFDPNATLLVLNVELNPLTMNHIIQNVLEK